MKTEELIRVVDRELDSLRYNIQAIRDRKTWTEETEAIFLRFRYEEEALQEIRTILSQMPEEEGEQSGELLPRPLCGAELRNHPPRKVLEDCNARAELYKQQDAVWNLLHEQQCAYVITDLLSRAEAAEARAENAEKEIERMKSILRAEGIAIIQGDCPGDKSKWNL